jgi:hypothetical protein
VVRGSKNDLNKCKYIICNSVVNNIDKINAIYVNVPLTNRPKHPYTYYAMKKEEWSYENNLRANRRED